MRRAVVIGRAAGAMDDYCAARALCTFDDVVVVGKMGEVFPDCIDHWVSFHVDLFDKWTATRASRGLPAARNFWGGEHKSARRRAYDIITTGGPLKYVRCVGGSSGFMAVQIALDELGAERVVLAGIPMRVEDSHFPGAASEKEQGAPWSEADAYWTTWEENMAQLTGRVRSMSGRTRERLGYPDAGWLAGGL